VLDFGISRPADETDLALTRTGAMMGTPMYMAPEQLAGVTAVDVRSDVYALGVVLYELLAGGAPFEGETFALLSAAKLRGDPLPLRKRAAHVPRALERVVLKALARDPAKRFPDVPTLAYALEPFADGIVFRTSEHSYAPAQSVVSTAPSTAMQVVTDRLDGSQGRSSSKLVVALAAVVLLIAVVGGTLAAMRARPPARAAGATAAGAASDDVTPTAGAGDGTDQAAMPLPSPVGASAPAMPSAASTPPSVLPSSAPLRLAVAALPDGGTDLAPEGPPASRPVHGHRGARGPGRTGPLGGLGAF